MKLSDLRYENRLVVRCEGRLDASWSDYFKETLLTRIRGGEHRIVLDAGEIVFLSSMGIRALMVLFKELKSVQGTFEIVNARGMVKDTLVHSGLGQWLSNRKIETGGAETVSAGALESDAIEHFALDASGGLEAQLIDAWQPWQSVREEACGNLRLERDRFAVGIGGAGPDYASVRDYLGEFLAVGGHVAVQPPDEHARPDCLLSEGAFVPLLQCVQAWVCRGGFSHLLRFRSTDENPAHAVSALVGRMLQVCAARAIGFVMVGEIDGLVGAALIRSPGRLKPDDTPGYPAIKDWLSFTGERVFAREQVLIAGVARRGPGAPGRGLSPLGSGADLLGHLHAAVFPYQLLPNGWVQPGEVADRFFKGPPPRAVLHLIDDRRPGVGLGESALFGGACWCAAIENSEVLS